ncbi:MAG: hypothetical protein OER04_15995 [Cyclobacteriaceae bacterium]|nr:hypothetical protein [Cyclobacteriaceae bacterium]
MTDLLKSQIFGQLKILLGAYSNELVVRGEKTHQYNLYGTKEVQLPHKLEKGMYFASTAINKGFVGFYFFPIYTHPHEFKNLDPALLKCLKGKSCFHIKKDDVHLYQAIRAALAQGYDLYKRIKYL